MQAVTIASLADVQRVESRPYAEFMAHGSVYAALADAAARHAERPALTFLDTAEEDTALRRWSHAALLAELHRAANAFTRLAGDEMPRVAMLLPPVPEAWFTLWGGEAAGVVCPINVLLDAAHIAELVRAAEANILVALGPHPQLDIWPRAEAVAAACPRLKAVLAVGGAPGATDFAAVVSAEDGAALVRPRDIDAGTPAALFHTGGTTGAPKLARHTHGNQLHTAWGAAQMFACDERDVVLNGFPLFHVAGSLVYGLSTLLAGGHLVLPTATALRNPRVIARWWQIVERHRVTLLAAVPTIIAALLGVDRGGASTASVRALLTGGSPLPNELAAAFEARHGIPVRNILGMTECAGVIAIEPLRGPRTPGSCGLRLPFTEVQAVRADGSRCAPLEPGVLRLRGRNVGPGYSDAARNPGTFEADGWLVSGDIGHLDAEGRLFVTGRAKDLIIRGGHNIDPGLIEEALLAHPQVEMAAAVGAPDDYAGELPVAFVTLRSGAAPDAAALQDFVASRIAERAACPKRIAVLPQMPLTAIGKVYKPALRAIAWREVFAERLAREGLDAGVALRVDERPGGLRLVFAVVAGQAAALEPRLRRLMQGFAVDWRVDEDGEAR